MNPTLIRAVGVVTLALVFYSIAVITEQGQSSLSRKVLFFLTAGIIFDITSTGLMIAGSGNIPITPHGFIGYSALLVMLIDTILVWRVWGRNRVRAMDAVTAMAVTTSVEIPRRLHIYTRLAFGWWVFAYIAGAIISVTL